MPRLTMDAVGMAAMTAGGLALIAALFGACLARMLWADDLKHAQRLRKSWDAQQTSMRKTIEYQSNTIEILERRISNAGK